MMLDPKGLEVAIAAWSGQPVNTPVEFVMGAAIRSYLSALTPAEAGGLVEELRNPDFRHEMQHLRPSSEIDRLFQQAATALEAKAAELARWKEAFVEQAKMLKTSTDAGLETLASLAAERAAHAETKRERDGAHDREMSAVIGETEATKRAEAYRAQLDEALNALIEIETRPEKMIWGEDHEIHEAMLDMSEIARRVREGGRDA